MTVHTTPHIWRVLNYAQPFVDALKSVPAVNVLSQRSSGINLMKRALYPQFWKQVFAA
jgi:hypothetical protein